jgi:hypothetical protein
LNWANQLALQRDFKRIGMDTWADNNKLITNYRSFGFEFIENYKTTNVAELPTSDRSLNVANETQREIKSKLL